MSSNSNPNLNEDSNFKVFVHGPNNVLVVATDEVIANFKDESLFALEVNPSGGILMRAVKKNAGSEWKLPYKKMKIYWMGGKILKFLRFRIISL